jgi:hypothetical protein
MVISRRLPIVCRSSNLFGHELSIPLDGSLETTITVVPEMSDGLSDQMNDPRNHSSNPISQSAGQNVQNVSLTAQIDHSKGSTAQTDRNRGLIAQNVDSIIRIDHNRVSIALIVAPLVRTAPDPIDGTTRQMMMAMHSLPGVERRRK